MDVIHLLDAVVLLATIWISACYALSARSWTILLAVVIITISCF
ncbi:MAG: hypothetical protein ACD_45C00657G0001, partial [uncultured bacterium]